MRSQMTVQPVTTGLSSLLVSCLMSFGAVAVLMVA